MKIILPILFLTFAAIFASGCSSVPAPGDGHSAICNVCRYNNDLGCLHVTVTDDTPSAVYEGRTYYFCSEDCQKAFLKNPKRYLANVP
jgi:YHS domain-containing protein